MLPELSAAVQNTMLKMNCSKLLRCCHVLNVLSLEGSISAIWICSRFLSHDGKFVEPDRKKQMSVHCKVYTKVLIVIVSYIVIVYNHQM